MKKIVFFSIPARGHTNPTLGVVKELVARGNRVWYYSYEMMRKEIEATGATFVPCDDYVGELKISEKDTPRFGKDLAFSVKVLVDTTLALDRKVCNDMAEIRPHCIVSDSMALWGKAVALKLGIPFVSSNTTFAFNRYSAKLMKHNFGELTRMLLAIPRITKDLKRLQRNGYPVKNVLDIIGSDENAHTVVYTSPEFQPCSETFSDKYAFVGPSVRPATETIHKTKNKLIYISMGTVNNCLINFYKNCVVALKNTDYRVIMSVGNLVSSQEFGDLPENISLYPHIDQIAVLEKADVFLSHCGMNSVNESLFFGVPLVMFPQTAEQQGVSERVLQLGAGIRLHKTDSKSIISAINEVLTNKTYKEKAEEIAMGFKNCSGAKGAADKIIAVCNNPF